MKIILPRHKLKKCNETDENLAQFSDVYQRYKNLLSEREYWGNEYLEEQSTLIAKPRKKVILISTFSITATAFEAEIKFEEGISFFGIYISGIEQLEILAIIWIYLIFLFTQVYWNMLSIRHTPYFYHVNDKVIFTNIINDYKKMIDFFKEEFDLESDRNSEASLLGSEMENTLRTSSNALTRISQKTLENRFLNITCVLTFLFYSFIMFDQLLDEDSFYQKILYVWLFISPPFLFFAYKYLVGHVITYREEDGNSKLLLLLRSYVVYLIVTIAALIAFDRWLS